MKRIGSCLLLAIPLALSSCGGNSALGTYSFQMGKQHGAHMTASITLKDNAVVTDKGATLGKALDLYVEANMGSKPASSEDSSLTSASSESSEATSSSFDLNDMLLSLLSEGLKIPGYYNIIPLPDEGKDQLSIGFTLDILKEITGEDFSLEPEVIEKIVYSEYDGKHITLIIPVSFADVVFQLYWYGFDLYDPLSEDIPEHALNTHPTKDDIARINQTYPDNHGGSLYRDFHCISLGLTKE